MEPEKEHRGGVSLLVMLGIVVVVLWVSKGVLALVAGLPLVSQILQVLGLVYIAEMLVEASGRRVQRLKWTMPPRLLAFASPAPTLPPEMPE